MRLQNFKVTKNYVRRKIGIGYGQHELVPISKSLGFYISQSTGSLRAICSAVTNEKLSSASGVQITQAHIDAMLAKTGGVDKFLYVNPNKPSGTGNFTVSVTDKFIFKRLMDQSEYANIIQGLPSTKNSWIIDWEYQDKYENSQELFGYFISDNIDACTHVHIGVYDPQISRYWCSGNNVYATREGVKEQIPCHAVQVGDSKNTRPDPECPFAKKGGAKDDDGVVRVCTITADFYFCLLGKSFNTDIPDQLEIFVLDTGSVKAAKSSYNKWISAMEARESNFPIAYHPFKLSLFIENRPTPGFGLKALSSTGITFAKNTDETFAFRTSMLSAFGDVGKIPEDTTAADRIYEEFTKPKIDELAIASRPMSEPAGMKRESTVTEPESSGDQQPESEQPVAEGQAPEGSVNVVITASSWPQKHIDLLDEILALEKEYQGLQKDASAIEKMSIRLKSIKDKSGLPPAMERLEIAKNYVKSQVEKIKP